MKRLIPLFFIFGLLMVGCRTLPSTSSSAHPAGTQPAQSQRETISGCPVLPKDTPAQLATGGPATLTVMGWSSTTAEDNLVRSQLADFQRLYPSIKVHWISVTGNYVDKMSILAAKNQLPDVFFMRPDMASIYISKQKLLDLSPYMQRDHVQTNAYYPALFTPFMCNSTVYGIPKDWNTLGLVYNKTLFQKAGLPFPNSTWTWNDLRTAARKLTYRSSDGIAHYGISLPDSSSRWLAFLFANNGSVLDASQKKSAFDTPLAIDAMTFYSSMQLQDHSSVLPGSLNASWAGQVFGEQRAAMVIEGGWLIPYLKESYPQVTYGFAPLPLSPQNKRANLLFTNAWAASATTKYAEASWDLIRYMTSSAAQKNTLRSGLALPSLASLTQNPSLQQLSTMKTLFDALPYSTLDYYGPQDTFIHNRLDLAVQNVLLGKMSVGDALANAATQINAALSP
ncbi:MAG TPA: sugar ABC transporter substrate-binding protein [Ktedonobacteraceae bacterium]|nr:sugar ABC transporter substrate-binding protein [Ktedonobacteraceae bacterium]